MKFNDEELAKFREDFEEEIQFLEKKYAIKITLGKIINDDSFFSARITAEHQEKNTTVEKVKPKTIVPRKPEVPVKKKVVKKKLNIDEVDLDNLSDSDLGKLDLDNLGLDDVLVPNQKKASEKVIVPRKPEVPVKKKVVKKKLNIDEVDLDNLSDSDLDKLDLDNLGLDDVVLPEVKEKEEIKPVQLPKEEKKKLSIEDIDSLSDEDLEALDIDSLEFDEPKKEETKSKKYDESAATDIEEISDEEFEDIEFRHDDNYDEDEDDDLSEFFDEKDEEPTSIFEEKNSAKYQKTTSYEDIDELLSGSGRYSYSFEAKLIQGEGLVQDFYTDMKNELLGYKGVSSRMSWDNDTFSYGRDILAKIDIENDSLALYLALDCDDYADSRYLFKDASRDSKYTYTPMKVLIRKFKDEESAVELIEQMMESFAIENEGAKYDDYHLDFETKEELIDRGLIKKI